MADTKLSALTELAAAPATGDELYIRDISEAASAESKRILMSSLRSNQAALEAETDEVTFASPNLLKHSPGVAKAWVRILADGTIESPDYNVDSITDTGTGDRTIVITTNFSTSVFMATGVLAVSGTRIATVQHDIDFSAFAVGSVRLVIVDEAGTAVDHGTSQALYGDQ